MVCKGPMGVASWPVWFFTIVLYLLLIRTVSAMAKVCCYAGSLLASAVTMLWHDCVYPLVPDT